MARSIEKIKFGLKLRTQPKEGALTLRVGTKKYTLPFEARLIQSDEYLFVHIPPAAEIMRVAGGKLEAVTKADEAEKAVQSFRKARKVRRAKKVEVPDAVKEALRKIPAGFKLGYDADGNMKLVKTRTKRGTKKAAAKPAGKRGRPKRKR